jgi:beta-lactam-binding protein with PASTA domain
MDFKGFITSSIFRKNLAIMLGVSVVIIVSVMFFLSTYTQHGDEYKTPQLTKLTLEQAAKKIEEAGLRYVVVDSVFIQNLPPNTVFEQDPAAGMLVKKDRIIYITVTKGKAPKVKLPNLIDMTIREATQTLTNAGFQLGKVIQRTDLATNAVLEMQYKGIPTNPGSVFDRNTFIDLVIGVYNTDSLVTVPNLVGLTADEARIMLYEHALNLGSVFYSGEIKDSTTVLVIKQSPGSNQDELINAASLVDIWLGDASEITNNPVKKE